MAITRYTRRSPVFSPWLGVGGHDATASIGFSVSPEAVRRPAGSSGALR